MQNCGPLLTALAVVFASIGVHADEADTVYLNGTILTVDAANSVARAVAVKGELIVAVGTNREVRRWISNETRVVDLDGRTMAPGFIDAHGHFPLSGSNALYTVDLNAPPIGSMRTLAEAVERLRAQASKTPKGQWVIGMGYDDTLLAEGRHPTRHDLDEVSEDHPVIAFHISLHIMAANSRALELAGIDSNTPQPQGGVIRHDPKTDEVTGVLEEIPAFWRVWSIIPKTTVEQSLDAIDHAARTYAAAGVTTAQNGRATQDDIDSLREAARRNRLPIRVVIYPVWNIALEMAKGGYRLEEESGGKLSLGAAKVVADGSIQGYTGYLGQPYHVPFHGDEAYRGYPNYPREKLVEMAVQMQKAGLQMAIHGNGDAAIDDVLHAFAEAQKAHPREDTRHVIIHAQMARDDQLDRMKELGVIPSFFVLHTYYWGDRHRDIFMGPERAARMSPARSALDRAIPITIHADTPVVPMEPLKLMWSAVNRISTSGAIIGESERIRPIEALRAMTITAAFQNFQEGQKGSIEAGKLADLVILSENPLQYPTRIKDVQVLETIVGGETVYRR